MFKECTCLLNIPCKTDGARNAQYAVFFVKLEPRGSRDDIAIVRLLDQNRSSRKMYSIKFSRVSGKISICESTRSRSFFFESERDQERVAINDLDVTTRYNKCFTSSACCT